MRNNGLVSWLLIFFTVAVLFTDGWKLDYHDGWIGVQFLVHGVVLGTAFFLALLVSLLQEATK